jgi:hypothetical protein
MKEACCASLILGIESGNEWLRTNVLERKMTNREILDKCALVHEAGLHIVTLNMFGLPFETKEMAEETLELNREISPQMCFAGPFRPYPGTALRETCIEQGWLKAEDPFLDRREPMMELPGLSREEIVVYASRLNALGIRQNLEKMPVGSYDFLVHFPEAAVESHDPSLCQLTFECNELDFLLRVAPLSRISYSLRVPRNTRIYFDISIESGKIAADRVGALFAVEVERLADGFTRKQRIFSRYIIHNQGWLDCEAGLEEYYEQDVRISFITVPGPALEDMMTALYWKRPFLSRIPSLREQS